MSSSNAISRIRHRFFNTRIVTFLICLAIASLLWVVHALNKNYKYTLTIPVKFSKLPDNKLIIGELPEKLQVEIKTSGLKLLFIKLQKMPTEVLIDFNNLKTNAKSQAYSISNGNFNIQNIINFDVDVIKIRPDTLFFSSQKGTSKLVPVKVNLQASFLPGYSTITKPTVTPAYVTVTGDTPEIDNIDTIYTQPVILKDVHENYSASIPIKKISSLNYSTKEIQLSFTVDRLTETSIKVPVQIINRSSTETVKLLPEFVTIHYLVAMKEYDNIDANSFKATVNFDDILAKKKTLSIDLTRSPSEAKIIKIEPATISYLIYK
ncbi:MAG: CdaR family protein [Bacteroidota bacterium]